MYQSRIPVMILRSKPGKTSFLHLCNYRRYLRHLSFIHPFKPYDPYDISHLKSSSIKASGRYHVRSDLLDHRYRQTQEERVATLMDHRQAAPMNTYRSFLLKSIIIYFFLRDQRVLISHFHNRIYFLLKQYTFFLKCMIEGGC